MVYPVEIRTDNLLIRELTLDDHSRFLQLSSDSDVVRYLAFGPTSDAEAQGMINFAIRSAGLQARTEYVLAIDSSSTGYLIGSCGLAIALDAPVSAEVFFVFRKDAWGNGYGSEVLRALIDFSFDHLNFRRVYGQAHPDNTYSIATMKRVGMLYEGVGENPLADAGDTQNGVRYSVLNRDN
jgi:ribosomal-protein-alanine N-acetyltransferase